jgi:hypothetical protein
MMAAMTKSLETIANQIAQAQKPAETKPEE